MGVAVDTGCAAVTFGENRIGDPPGNDAQPSGGNTNPFDDPTINVES